MNLRIKPVDKKYKRRKLVAFVGEIQIDGFKEWFDSSLDWWSVNDYELQWKNAFARLLDHDTSCLVVAINDPACRKFVEWWPLYKFDNKIHIQNHIIIDSIYEERIGDNPFTVQTCYNFIPKYRSHNENGDKISEWVIDWDEKNS